jgi:hypothetical protein
MEENVFAEGTQFLYLRSGLTPGIAEEGGPGADAGTVLVDGGGAGDEFPECFTAGGGFDATHLLRDLYIGSIYTFCRGRWKGDPNFRTRTASDIQVGRFLYSLSI